MKPFLLVVAVVALGLGAQALEREQESGGVEEAVEGTTQTPVVVLKSKDTEGDAEDSDEVTESGPTRCSPFVCRLKCQLNGCIASRCVEGARCVCFCPRYPDPFEQFIHSISRLEPGLIVRPRPVHAFPSFGFLDSGLNHGSVGFSDLDKLLRDSANSEGANVRVFRTMQMTCPQAEDCSSACANCTQSLCEENLCRCSDCSREGVESRSTTNVLQACQGPRACIDHCKGCIVTTCRYGFCECEQCPAEAASTTTEASAETTTATEAEDKDASTPATSTVAAADDEEATEPTTAIVTVLTNGTVSAAESLGHGGKCVPKRCNTSCWERQCSKWNCVADRCECDGCPEEVAVVVKNVDGKPEKLEEDKIKYEIIF